MDEPAAPNDHFPESGTMFRSAEPVRYERFAELRESLMYDLADGGVKHATLLAYWGDLESLLHWCVHNDVDVLAPTTADIGKFLDDLREQRYSLNTIARHITSFRQFYDFLADVDELESSPMTGIHQRRPRPRPQRSGAPQLTTRQRRRMIDAASDSRDLAVLSLLFDRVSVTQFCNAKVIDLNTGPPATLTTCYRGIPETAVLGEDTARALLDHLDGRRTGPLVSSDAGQALDRFAVNRLLARVAERAGIRSPVGPARLPQRASRVPRASRQTSSTD